MWAAMGGHKEVIELLLNHGADPSAVNWVRGNDDDDDDDDDDECD
jgi:ankyrin repeat protein